MKQDKLTYSVEEMAKVLGIGKNTAYNLTKKESFPIIRMGKKIKIPIVALNKWLENCNKI